MIQPTYLDLRSNKLKKVIRGYSIQSNIILGAIALNNRYTVSGQ